MDELPPLTPWQRETLRRVFRIYCSALFRPDGRIECLVYTLVGGEMQIHALEPIGQLE